MKIAVLGAGIVGITTAYQLTRDGHEVVIVDRQPDVSLECSYANGGFIAISQAVPWSSPGVLLRVLTTMFRSDAPILLHPSQLPKIWRWGIEFLSCSSAPISWENTKHILSLALYSLDVLRKVRDEARVEYFKRTNGCLKIYADQHSFDEAARSQEAQIPLGINFKVLDTSQCMKMVPALGATQENLAGGIYVPDEEGGDCYEFAKVLSQRIRDAGGTFRFSSAVERFEMEGDRVAKVITAAGPIVADRYVLAAGADAPLIMHAHGVRLPIIPVKGYSLTLPRDPWPDAPDLQIVDEKNLFGLNPLGTNRLRLAGLAEIAGYNTTPQPRRTDAFIAGFLSRFPQLNACLNRSAMEPFCCLRPVTPNGLPILGQSRFTNLFYNIGHGHLGWTLAHGTARIVADLIAGKPPALDVTACRPRPTY
jgi:D-amino-acid dehydrogenase